MKNLLYALEKKNTIAGRCYISTLMFVTILGFIILFNLIYINFSIPVVIFHNLCWIIWFYWQGKVFYENRIFYLRRYPNKAYKQAFYRDILFGVSFGVAQMLQPLFIGIYSNNYEFGLIRISLFLFFVFLGIFLLIAGFRAIGFSAAGFLYEFLPKNKQTASPFIIKGIYKYMRHPLFIGGVLASFGSSLIFNTEVMMVGISNLLILPIYIKLEDRRQLLIWKKHFADYKKKVKILKNMNKKLKA